MSRLRALSASVFLAVAAAASSGAAPVVTTAPVATDVTDRSFAVVWQANQPARGTLRLFADDLGTTPIVATEGVVSDGAKHPSAELAGTVRVRAIGLPLDSDVFYQVETISVVDGTTTLTPAAPPFPSVRLQRMAGLSWFDLPFPMHNDLAEIAVRGAGGTVNAPGALVLIDLSVASHPVTAFVGEAGVADAAVVDLNNLYDEIERAGYVVQGGETAAIKVLGGNRGTVDTTATLAASTGGVRLVSLLAAPVVLPTAVPACGNGLDDDADTLVDTGDTGCSSYTDTSERAANKICDDGVDNDGDGGTDYPGDVGCRDPGWGFEAPQCDDGNDNDSDGKIDWDGGPGAATPDPQCTMPWRNNELPGGCGIGFELALVMPLLWALRSRRQR